MKLFFYYMFYLLAFFTVSGGILGFCFSNWTVFAAAVFMNIAISPLVGYMYYVLNQEDE